MSAQGDKVVLKANLARVRDLSFVGRFHHNYGFENAVFEYLLLQKALWQDKLFYFNEDQFSSWVQHQQHAIRQIPTVEQHFPDIKGKSILPEEFQLQFGQTKPIHINVSRGAKSTQSAVEPGSTLPLKTSTERNAFAVNVGGSITAVEWLPYGDLLAVAVVNTNGEVNESVGASNLSIFSKSASAYDSKTKTSIQIWKFDSSSQSLTIQNTLNTSKFGGVAKLNWVPSQTGQKSSGTLSGNFSDGKVHFFRIDNKLPAFVDVTEPSWTISLLDERRDSKQIIPITAYSFFDESKVLVGTLDGAIAEFALPGYDEELSAPSFVEYVVDSCINSITIADVLEDKVLLVNTATSQSYAFQYSNLRQSRVETHYTILPLQPQYHKGFKIFVYPDSSESIGYTFARHPHLKHSLLLKTDMVTSFSISQYLNHPLAIVGNAVGDVHVLNLGRKLLGVLKEHNKLVVPLRLWSLTTPDNGATLNLSADYLLVQTDKPDVMMSFTPAEVAISASAWNESLEGSTAYVFGTYTGLLVLERLDPSLS